MGEGFENFEDFDAEVSHTGMEPGLLEKCKTVFDSRSAANCCCLKTGAEGGSIGKELTAAAKMTVTPTPAPTA